MHMEEAANLICSLQQTLGDLDTVLANVNERSKRTILHIETAAQRILQTVTEHRHKLVSKVNEITEAKLQALQAEKESVQENFRAVENVLRSAQSTSVVEDSEEWNVALAKQLSDMKEQDFDFQVYDEDMRFHFLYRDEKLLAAICKFGEVFTIANDHPRNLDGTGTCLLQQKEPEALQNNCEEREFTDRGESGSFVTEFQGEVKNPDQNTETQCPFEGEVLNCELSSETQRDGAELVQDDAKNNSLSRGAMISNVFESELIESREHEGAPGQPEERLNVEFLHEDPIQARECQKMAGNEVNQDKTSVPKSRPETEEGNFDSKSCEQVAQDYNLCSDVNERKTSTTLTEDGHNCDLSGPDLNKEGGATSAEDKEVINDLNNNEKYDEDENKTDQASNED